MDGLNLKQKRAQTKGENQINNVLLWFGQISIQNFGVVKSTKIDREGRGGQGY